MQTIKETEGARVQLATEMKQETTPRGSARRAVVAVLLAFSLALTLQPRAVAQSPPKPLSKDEVVRLLNGDVTPKRVAELARERGIDFQVTAEVDKELRGTGADDALLSVLREVAPKPVAPSALQPTLQAAPKQPVERQPTPPKPLSKDEVVRLLKGDVPPKRVAEIVREREIQFQVTPEIEKQLRAAGADDILLSALREPAPNSQVLAGPQSPSEQLHPPARGTVTEKRAALTHGPATGPTSGLPPQESAQDVQKQTLQSGAQQTVASSARTNGSVAEFAVVHIHPGHTQWGNGHLEVYNGRLTFKEYGRGAHSGDDFSVSCDQVVKVKRNWDSPWFHVTLATKNYNFWAAFSKDDAEEIVRVISSACGHR